MTDDPRNLAAHRVRVLKEVDRNGGETDSEARMQVVARNEVALAHHLQVAAHKDRIGADRADDKLIKVNPFYKPPGSQPGGFFSWVRQPALVSTARWMRLNRN